MVQFAHNGLELWYGTPDAEAAVGVEVPRDAASITVGVRPSATANSVHIRYSVDGDSVQILRAPLVSTDYATNTQYFRAQFPTFWSGDLVEYLPVLTCSGRQAPGPETTASFPTSFRLARPLTPAQTRWTPTPEAPAARLFQPRLEHLVSVAAPLAKQPELIGQTPAGYLVNWPPIGGRLVGSAFHATVIPGGEHETTVRPDGVGILDVRVTVETDDHALISLRYTGTVDYGADWVDWLRAGSWPDVLPVRSEIRMLTAHPAYQWLNRLQCIGVGEVYPRRSFYRYDVYAIR